MTFLTPEQFKWRDPFNKSPTNQVVLYGDPSKEGPYMVINRFTPGAFSRPHFHPNDRFITVLKGTWWVGTGPKFDTNTTLPMPAGTFVTHYRPRHPLRRRQGRRGDGADHRHGPGDQHASVKQD